jgi:hypothetical protein
VSLRWLPNIRLGTQTAARERNTGTEKKRLHDDVMMIYYGRLSNTRGEDPPRSRRKLKR